MKKKTVIVAGVNEFGEYLPPVELTVNVDDDPAFDEAQRIANERLRALASNGFSQPA